jgi:hypothetical protein
MVHPSRFLLNFGEIEKYKDGNTFCLRRMENARTVGMMSTRGVEGRANGKRS